LKASKFQLLPDVSLNTGMDYYWKIPVQLFPAEIIGGQQGTFIPVKLGRSYVGTYGAEANLDLLDVRKWNDIKLALLQKQLTISDVEAYKKVLIKNVKLSYYNLALTVKNEGIADSLYTSYQLVDSLIHQRFKEGITDKITLNQSRQLLLQAKVQAQSASTASNIAFLNLKVWMGYPLDENLVIETEGAIPAMVLSSFDASVTPEYELEQLKIEAAKQAWQQAKTAWLPKLSLTSGYSKTGFGDNLDFISKGEWYPSGYAGVKFSLPLSDLYKLKPYAAKQKITWEQSKLNLDNYVFEKEKEFQEAQLLLKKYKGELSTNEQSWQLTKENESLTLQKLQNGIVDMTQLRQVQNDLYRLQNEYHSIYLNYLTQYVDLLYLQSNQ
jgi:outer membrane protein TolC